jgi:para-nitrobenzyl esterase
VTGVVTSTPYGRVRGHRHPSGIAFHGIPFAAPPVGERRFRPPVPPQSWTGVRECAEDGPACPQPPASTNRAVQKMVTLPVPEDEDCLYLNVWTPSCDNERRPVMVWIHGGAFRTGSGSTWPQQTGSFSRDGVVLVTVNYRLHAFGHLYLDGLFEDAEDTGNVGLLDQVAALQWVRDNIAEFGGDPDNVTVFGESAGGLYVSLLMASPSADGLFRRGIVMSAAGNCTSAPDEARKVSEAFLRKVDVRPGDWVALEQLPAATIVAAASAPLFWPRPPADRILLDFLPVVDGSVLPATPHEAVASGRARAVPLLVGSTAHEWRLAHFAVPGAYPPPDLDALSDLFAESSIEELPKIYRDAWPDASPADVNAAVDTDLIFGVPAIRLAEAQAKHQPDVWRYRFDWPTPAAGGVFGACHALDVPLVFDALDDPELLGDEAPAQLATDLHQAWIRFATNGDPNGGELPEWPRYDLDHRPTMSFDERSRLCSDPDAERRRYWANWPRKGLVGGSSA